jgi:5'(3')-deoxyribonucleotidase
VRLEGFYVNEKSNDTSRERTSDFPVYMVGTSEKKSVKNKTEPAQRFFLLFISLHTASVAS